MKIEVFYVWLAAILLVFVFQNFFTVRKSEWDVSYTYTTESMDYIAYGQMALTCSSDKVSWLEARSYLKEHIAADEQTEEPVLVTVLALHRSSVDRYWQPFWKTFAS